MSSIKDYQLTRHQGTLLKIPDSVTSTVLLNKGELSGSSVTSSIGFEFEFDKRKHTQFVAFSSGFIQLVGEGSTLFPSSSWLTPSSYWTFDNVTMSGSTSIKDICGTVTGTINNATVNLLGHTGDGEAIYTTTGSSNPGIEFQTGSYIFHSTEAFSIGAWVKRETTAIAGHILSKASTALGVAGWHGYALRINTGGSVLFDMTPNPPSLGVNASINVDVDDGEWHHIICEYDGNIASPGLSFFVDGIQKPLTASSIVSISGWLAPSASLRIGSQISGTNVFSGSIDDVAIWKRQLSSTEVKQIFDLSKKKSYIFDSPMTSSILFGNHRSNRDPILAPWLGNLSVANDTGTGVRSWIDNTDQSGNKKLVVDFRCVEWRDQTSTNARTLPFQVVLHEHSNAIEFIYGASTITGSRAEPGDQAAIGVRGYGFNFRNFFTGSDRFGGSMTSTRTPDSASAGGWPGDGTLNSYLFRPEKTKTHLLVSSRLREEQRSRDYKLGSYPLGARTGDNERRGKISTPFDDRNTLIFGHERNTSAGIISFPTRMQPNHPALKHGARSFIAPSIAGESSAKFATDDIQWMSQIEHTIPTIAAPFNEHALFEQNAGSFFETGSNIADVWTRSLQAPLRSKPTIRLSLPIGTNIQLQAQTASIYYYNSSEKTFELIGASQTSGSGHVLGSGHDSKLFGPFGTIMLSGSSNRSVTDTDDNGTAATYVVPSTFYSASISASNVISDVFQEIQSGSVLLNSAFTATSSQIIDMSDYINHPFLLEKAVIRLPLRAGTGWLSDRTRALFGSASFSRLDVGGPCITVSLLRQENDSLREVILSGTVIPTNDNVTDFEVIMFNGTVNVQEPEGFASFATPNAIVFPDGTTFTGSVDIRCIAAKANGFLSYVPARLNSAGDSLITGSFFDSRIISMNSPGRACDTVRSSRSVFKSDIILPQTPVSAAHNPSHRTGSGLFFFETNETSPYLLLPNDRLVLALSKHRPIRTRPEWDSRHTLTGSHDVSVATGSIEIALYGSFLKLGEATDDSSLNQYLASNAINETIGTDDIIVDQWDIERNVALSGSYTTHIFEGSLLASNRKIVGNHYGTQFNFSTASHLSLALRSGSDYRGIARFLKCTDAGERFWDSLVPDPIEMFQANNASAGIWLGTDDSETNNSDENIPFYIISSLNPNHYPGQIVDFLTASILDYNILRTFPFEPRYAHINRTTRPFSVARVTGQASIGGTPSNIDFVKFSETSVGGFRAGGGSSVFEERQYRDVSIAYLVGSSSQQATKGTTQALFFLKDFTPSGSAHGFDEPRTRNYDGIPPLKHDLLRHVFGFGKSYHTISSSFNNVSGTVEFVNTQVEFSKVYPLSSSVGGSSHSIYNAVGARPVGWRYGLISALPHFSTTVFRQNKFGQFRDMLEQRQDSKFFLGKNTSDSPITISFVDDDNLRVDPKSTDSSNLSTEATASIPYVDGIARNRENPFDLSLTQTQIIKVD